MPEIKDLSALGIGRAERPNLTRFESVDLQYNPNEYDLNYVPGENQMYNRSSNQSWGEQLAQGLVGRTLSLVPKILGGFGSVASIPQALADGSFAPMWENSLTVAMNEADEKLKEVFPVYQSRNYADSGLVGKFGTTSFWASDAFDAIAFAASAYVPGAAASKAGSVMSTALRGTKIADSLVDAGSAINATIDAATASSKAAASVVDVAKTTSKYLKKMMPENAGTVAFSTAYNTVAEAGVEAYGVKKELMDYYMNVKGLTYDEANEKASVQAERVFKTNMGVLIIPNLVQSMFFHGASKSVHNKVKESIWRNGSKDLEAVIGKNNMLKSIAKGIGSEGFIEENAQTSAQQYERLLAADRLSDEDNYFRELAYGMYDNTKGFVKSFIPGAELTEEQMEGSVAIGLGGLIGGGFGVIGATRDRKAFMAAKDYETKRYEELFTGDTGKVASLLFSDNKNYIYKLDKTNPYREVEVDGKKVSIPNFELDQNNNPIIDEQAVTNLTVSSAFNKRLWDAHQVAMYRNNPTMLELNKNIALASLVNKLMVRGYTEEEIGLYLDDFEQNGNKFAEEIGVESDIKSNIQTLKNMASELSTIESRMPMSLRDRNPQFASFKRANLMYLTTKLNTLRTLDPKTEGVLEAIQDTQEHIDFLNSKDSEAEFAKFYTNRATLEAKLSNLQALKDKTSENLEEINSITYELKRQDYVDGYNPLKSQEQTAATRGKGKSRVTNIGLRNELSSAYGRTKLAVEDINNNPNDPLEVKMRKFNNIEISNPEVEELKAKLDEEVTNKLTELDAKDREVEIVEEFYQTEIADQFEQEGDQFVLNLPELFANYGIAEDSGLAQSIINALGVDPNTPVTYDVFSNVAQGNAEEFFNSVKENYAKVREKFDNFLNTPTSSLMQEGDTFIKEWENSLMNNKENEFLDGKFLDQMFVKPAKNFIKEVENDDEFDDDFALYQISNNLKVAVDYLKSVNHPRYNEIKQLYDYITLTLQNKIIDNLSKRAEKHKVINNAVSRNMLEIVQMLFPDNPKVKSVLDVFDDEVISFDGVMTLLSELKNTLTQDEVDALLDRLSNIDYSKDFQNFPEILNKLQGQFKRIVRNPIGVMTQMIDRHYADTPPYITKFLGDYDFYALEKAGQLKNDPFAVQLSRTFNSVIGHALIEDLLTSKKFDYSKFVEIKNELEPSPSLQQNIALTQGLLFLLNDNNKSMMLSRGIGGSGKSYMLGPSLMKIYKELTGDTKEVYAFSKSDLASKNINNAIHNDPNKGSFENFETINVDNYAYIIVDEVYTFTNEELEYIFSKTGSKTKVIMLGDPSQVKAETDYLIDTSVKANDIRLSIPLTTSYRTNVSQISSFISRFQLTSEPVTSAVVTASDDFIQINDTSTINGVATGTVEDIRRLASMPSTRSRVIIVGSEAAKVDFQGLSIPVLTVQESQGYQWDEVYSYLDVNDLPIDTFEKNKFYYTAYSRAKNFLFINHAGVVNTAPNSQITSNIALANKELTDAAQMYKDNLTNAKLVADILNGRVTLVPPSAFAIAEDDSVFSGNPDVAEDAANSNAYIDVPVEQEFFQPDNSLRSFAYPSNIALSEDVDFSSPARIVKIDSNGTIKLAVLARTTSGRYRVMSYLGKVDFDINPAFLSLLDTNNASIASTEALVDMDIPNIDIYSTYEVDIVSYRKMGNNFDPLNSANSIDEVISRFESSYFGASEAGVIRIQDPNTKLKYSVKIFKRSDASKLKTDYPNFTPKYGVPYLVVDNIKEVGSDKTRSHLIQLNPSRFSKSSPLYAPIRALYDNIRFLEQEFNAANILLGTEDFAELVRNYSDFYKADDTSMALDPTIKGSVEFRGQVLTPAQENAVGKIVELIFGVSKQPLTFKDEDTAQKWLEANGQVDGEDYIVKGHRIVSIVENNSGRFIFKYSNDPNDPDSVATYLESRVTESKGPAAKALNDIARANARLNDRQLRITLTSGTKKYTRFASVLSNFNDDGSPKTFIDFELLYRDYAISTLLNGVDISKIRDSAQLKRLLVEGSKSEAAIKAFPELKDNPLTDEQAGFQIDRFQAGPTDILYLEDIVGDNSFDSEGKHIPDPNYGTFALREPLNMNEINTLGQDVQGNADKLNSLLYSDFAGVAKTEIRYLAKEQYKPVTLTIPDGDVLYSEILDNLPGQSPELQLLIDSIRDQIKDVVFEHVPQGVPDKNGKLVKNVILTSNGRVYSPVPFSKVPVEILIHEAIHAVADASLDKGLLDAKARRDTPEARFYKKVSALRKRFISAVRNKKDENGNKLNLKSFFQDSPSDPTAKEFLASLSNENFRKTAQDISALPKARKKVSIFRQLLEEILNLLGLREDATLYEALTETLLDFYRTTPIITTQGSTVVDSEQTVTIEAIQQEDPSFQVMNHTSLVVTEEEVEREKATYLSNLNDELSGIEDEFEFETRIDELSRTGNFENLPSYGDTDIDVTLSSAFNNLPLVDQLNFLKPPTSGSYAYFTTNKDFIDAQEGSIRSTKVITSEVDKVIKRFIDFKNPIDKAKLNLVKAIVVESISSPELDMLNTLKNNQNNRLFIMQMMYNEVFSRADKYEFSVMYNTTSPDEVVSRLAMEDDPIGNNIIASIALLDNVDIASVKDMVEGRAAHRYTKAKEFLLGLIAENKNKDNASSTSLILSRNEVLATIETKLKDPNTVFASGTLSDINKEINNLISEQVELSSKNRTSSETARLREVEAKLSALQDEFNAYQALKSINRSTGRMLYKDLIKDIYPKTSFDDAAMLDLDLELAAIGEEEYYSKDRVDKEIAEAKGIVEFLKLTNVSRESTLSESMKDSLAFIEVNGRYLSAGLAYIKTMQLLTATDWTQGAISLIDQLSEVVNSPGISITDRAIAENVLNTIKKAYQDKFLDGVSLPTSMGILTITSKAGAVSYRAYYKEGLSYIPSLEEAISDSTIQVSNETFKTSALFDFMKSKDPNLTIPQFNRYFTKAEAINTVRGMANTMASMKDTELYIATRSLKQGVNIRMIRSKSSDVSFTIKEHIQTTLYDMYIDGRINNLKSSYENSTINSQKIKDILSSGTPDQKIQALKRFYNFFNIQTNDLSIAPSGVSELIEKINGLLNVIGNLRGYYDIEDSTDLKEKGSDTLSFEDWLEEYDGYVTAINDVAGKSDMLIRNPSVLDLDGNRFYKFHESSFMYDQMLNLISIDSQLFDGSKGTSKKRKVPSYILSDFYKHNPFVRHKSGLRNTVYAIGEFAGSKNLDNLSTTSYLRENRYFYFQRKFVSGFMDGLKQSNGKSYFQFSYIPSDSPKHPVFKVGLIPNSDINNHIQSIINQSIEKLDVNFGQASEITPSDKIIFGHPGIGKTYLRESGKAGIIDFDSDYKSRINVMFGLEEGFKARNDFQKNNKEQYQKAIRELWEEAKQEAAKTGKRLFASDLILLREFSNDFNKVISMPKETFIERAKQRNDYTPGEEGTEGWKGSLDKEISKFDSSKVISTDKYLEDLLAIYDNNVVHYKNSVNNDLFRNFSPISKALEQLKLDPIQLIYDAELVKKVANKAEEIIEKEALDYLTSIINDTKPSFDVSFAATMFNVISRYNKSKEKGEDIGTPINPKFDAIVKEMKEVFSKNKFKSSYKSEIKYIQPMFELMYKNNAINSYFLNQLYLGDPMFYKDSPDVVKRFAGVKAPGIKGFIDPKIGMKEKYNLGILADTAVGIEETKEVFKNLFYGENDLTPAQQKEFDDFMAFFGNSFESTDAQGFMTPARLADMSKGFEKSWELGTVHKPVHFGVYPHEFTREDGSKYKTAKPVYVKNSTVVLTDDLVSRFPLLGKLRDAMVRQDLDELVFKSAVKEGAPDAKYFTMQELLNDENLVIPKLELSNHNFRLQFNAAADPNKKVAIFTQLQYFLNVYGTSLDNKDYANTQEAARKVYSLVADLIDMGADDIFSGIDSSLKSFLRREFKGPASLRALEILNSGTDINHPLIEKKAITAITSAIEKETIKIKFNGGKLVLQSAEGISLYPGTDQEVDESVNRLRYRNEMVNGRNMMVAEVILPRELLTPEQLEQVQGNKEPLYAMPDGFAFRIPSTELHSAIAFRVVGTYSNKKSNVIIVPKEVVPIHGSDFDVDSLFVITREIYDKDDLNVYDSNDINGIISKIALLYNTVADAQKANPEATGEYIRLRKAMNTVFKVSSDIDVEDIESSAIEQDYNRNLALPGGIQDKAAWATANGYRYNSNSNTFAVRSRALSSLNKNMGVITDIIDKTPELSNFKTAINDIKDSLKNLQKQSEYEAGKPVGHILENDVYVLDNTQMEDVNRKLGELQTILNSLQDELVPLFKKDIESSIDSLKSIKKKLIRNNIIDVMLKVITDPANRLRMTTPIAFVPIDNVLESTALKPFIEKKTFDLSTMEGEFEAYAALTAGVVLTGAFANSAKSFGYLAQAGASSAVNNLYNYLYAVDSARSVSDITTIADSLGITIKLKPDSPIEAYKTNVSNKIKKLIDTTLSNEQRTEFNSPILSKARQFSITIDDTTYNVDKLSDKDILGNYTVTQVLDALTNAAIDNLKLGLLPKARINQYTGSAVVGLVSTGVPIDFVIHLLYQGVFNDLFTGRVQNIDTWLSGKLKEYETYPDVVVDYGSLKINVGKVTNEDKVTTANALRLFAKAHKIGEDMRNFSNFLGVIQSIDPFVEDLFSVIPKAEKEIGKLKIINGKFVLTPNESFSFVSTNILQSAPHVESAVRLLSRTVQLIEDRFVIHSKDMQKFADTIDSVYSERIDSFTTNSRIRRTFARYILASTPMVMERLAEVKPKTITVNTGEKGSKRTTTLSGQRVFNDEVANNVQKLQLHEAKTAVFGASNYFLKHISTPTSENGTKVIKFRSSIGLSPEDIGKIVIGFRELSKYYIDEQGEVRIVDVPMNFISPIQKDLVIYALLNLGLENMSSSFAAYLPPSMFEAAVNYYVRTLNNLIDSNNLPKHRDHFNLYYNLANSKSLVKPDYTLEEKSPKGTKHGMEIIDQRPIYYNIKYNVDNESDPTKKHSFPLFIKETYNKDTTVYIKVYQTEDNKKVYYQRVGKIKDVYTNDMLEDYKIDKYFAPGLVSLPVLDTKVLKDNSVEITTPITYDKSTETYSGLGTLLEQDDVFAYYPNDNFDRSQRKFGKFIRKSSDRNILSIVFKPVDLNAVARALSTNVPTLLNTDTKELLEHIKCHG